MKFIAISLITVFTAQAQEGIHSPSDKKYKTHTVFLKRSGREDSLQLKNIFESFDTEHKIYVSLFIGVGSTDVHSYFKGTYSWVNPRVGYVLGRFIVGADADMASQHNYISKEAGGVIKTEMISGLKKYGLFARYYTQSTCVSFIELKARTGEYYIDSNRYKLNEIVISPGWTVLVHKSFRLEGMMDVSIGELVKNNFDIFAKFGGSIQF